MNISSTLLILGIVLLVAFSGCKSGTNRSPTEYANVCCWLGKLHDCATNAFKNGNDFDRVYAEIGGIRLALKRHPTILPFSTVQRIFGEPDFHAYAVWEYVYKAGDEEVLIFFKEFKSNHVGDIDIVCPRDECPTNVE